MGLKHIILLSALLQHTIQIKMNSNSNTIGHTRIENRMINNDKFAMNWKYKLKLILRLLLLAVAVVVVALVDTRAKNNEFLKENALYSIGIQRVDEFRGARVPIRAKMLNLKYGVLE